MEGPRMGRRSVTLPRHGLPGGYERVAPLPPPLLTHPLPPFPFPASKSLVAHLQAARAPILSASSPFGVLRAETVSPIPNAANHSRVFLSGEGSGGQTLI